MIPTRDHNIFDLVLTNTPSIIANVEVTDNLPLTDHDAIQFDLLLMSPPQEPCSRTLYNYKKADLSELNPMLSHVPWNLVEQCDDFEEAWTLFKDLIFGVVDAVVPRLKWRRNKLKHWFSYATIYLIRQKHCLYSRIKSSSSIPQSLLSKYRCVSNQLGT